MHECVCVSTYATEYAVLSSAFTRGAHMAWSMCRKIAARTDLRMMSIPCGLRMEVMVLENVSNCTTKQHVRMLMTASIPTNCGQTTPYRPR